MEGTRHGESIFPPTDKTHALAADFLRARGAAASRAAERLGHEGALNAARRMGKQVRAFSGRDVVDVIALAPDAILVLEGLGCGSRAPRRRDLDSLRAVAGRMERSTDPERCAAGRLLSDALRRGDPPVRYLEARTGVDPKTAKATPTVVREYGP